MTTDRNYLNGFQCLYSADQENLNRKQNRWKKSNTEERRGISSASDHKASRL